MAYHLSHEARAGLSEFKIPGDLNQKLLEFQAAAVKIAAHHIHKRGGVLIGDVVGLGKTLIGTAVAWIFDDDLGYDTLIICPKNLLKMWETYRDQYRLRAKVLSLSKVLNELPNLRRYRLVLIDESHNLRNREGKKIALSWITSRRMRAKSSYLRRPHTIKPIWTFQASYACSSQRTKTWASGQII
jgi:SNF2 family DNA or RNA helicase